MVPDKGRVAPLDPEVRAEIHPVLCARNPIVRVYRYMLTYISAHKLSEWQHSIIFGVWGGRLLDRVRDEAERRRRSVGLRG